MQKKKNLIDISNMYIKLRHAKIKKEEEDI